MTCARTRAPRHAGPLLCARRAPRRPARRRPRVAPHRPPPRAPSENKRAPARTPPAASSASCTCQGGGGGHMSRRARTRPRRLQARVGQRGRRRGARLAAQAHADGLQHDGAHVHRDAGHEEVGAREGPARERERAQARRHDRAHLRGDAPLVRTGAPAPPCYTIGSCVMAPRRPPAASAHAHQSRRTHRRDTGGWLSGQRRRRWRGRGAGPARGRGAGAHGDNAVGQAARGEAADGEVDQRRGQAQHAEHDAAVRGLPAERALREDGQAVDVRLRVYGCRVRGPNRGAPSARRRAMGNPMFYTP